MNTVTGQEISDEIFTDKANTDALDGFLLALAEGNAGDADKYTKELRKAAQAAIYELSGEKEFDEWVDSVEFSDYVASIHHAAMM